MNINDHILNIFRTEMASTYWFKSPTPGTGTYAVLDIISDIGSMSKDIAIAPHVPQKLRLQCKVYSDDTTDARTNIDLLQNLIRTTVNNGATGVVWLHAQDDNGIKGGYDGSAKRYYYLIDFFIWYKTYSV